MKKRDRERERADPSHRLSYSHSFIERLSIISSSPFIRFFWSHFASKPLAPSLPLSPSNTTIRLLLWHLLMASSATLSVANASLQVSSSSSSSLFASLLLCTRMPYNYITSTTTTIVTDFGMCVRILRQMGRDSPISRGWETLHLFRSGEKRLLMIFSLSLPFRPLR